MLLERLAPTLRKNVLKRQMTRAVSFFKIFVLTKHNIRIGIPNATA